MAVGGLGRLFDIGVGVVPVDLQTAQTGKRVHLKNYGGVTAVFFKAAGTAGDDPTIDLQQHTAATGGTTADLDVATRYYLKREATLDGDEQWETFTQSAASEIADPGGGGTSAEEQQLLVVEVSATQLSDGYEWFSVDVADTGTNAQLGCVLYLLHTLRYEREPTLIPQPNA